ncbi:MAG: hypothetical protein M1822_001714 [Bathelium mastoideum]|nr:MAG: hypothetical protein M1822_001714 [Bathelium mastoideum]
MGVTGIVCATDDAVLVQICGSNPGNDEQQKQQWTDGLKSVVRSFRETGTRDVEIAAKKIADYRREFLHGSIFLNT